MVREYEDIATGADTPDIRGKVGRDSRSLLGFRLVDFVTAIKGVGGLEESRDTGTLRNG